MSIPRGAALAVSFDYGHVLGGLDVGEIAGRLVEAGLLASDADRAPVVERMRGAMADAYKSHDESIARGQGHERAWFALMKVVVSRAPIDGQSIDAPSLDAFVAQLWRDQPSRNLWRDVPADARALLDDLASARVKMVVTSNSEGRAKELLHELGIGACLVDVIDSGVLGVSKPDRRIFERAASVVGVPLASLVHVGDSEAADVVGAKDAGAWAIRFDAFVPGAASRPTVAHARASTFADLRAALANALDVPLANARDRTL
jgi:FMN phosphatase YigB (HAD superfamily)